VDFPSITVRFSREKIFNDLCQILDTLIKDYDTEFTGGITPETRLVADLGVDSLTIVMLIVAIEGNFKRRGLPFEELLVTDGKVAEDLFVSDVVNFLDRHFNA
jgi:acyl carrier protein